MDLLLDGERSAQEVDVADLEAEKLAGSQAGAGGDDHECAGLLGRRRDDLLNLVEGERLDAASGDSGEGDAEARVARDDPVADGRGEHCADRVHD